MPELRGATGVCVQLKGSELGFGFQDGPLRGKAIRVPISAVRRLDDDNGLYVTGGANEGNCASGNCGAGNCGSGCDAGLSSEFVTNALDIVSVKVPSMDAEHDECAAALRLLAQQCSAQALQAALSCLGEHFRHEEALFEE